MGYSPWGCKELDMTEQPTHTQYFPIISLSSLGQNDYTLFLSKTSLLPSILLKLGGEVGTLFSWCFFSG